MILLFSHGDDFAQAKENPAHPAQRGSQFGMKNHFCGDYQKLTRNQILRGLAKILSLENFGKILLRNLRFSRQERKFVSFRSAKLGPFGS